MSPTLTTKLLLCHMLIVLLTLKLAYASPSMKPSDTSKESFEEVDDLLSTDSNKNKLSSEDTAEPYSHRDEDQLLAKAENLKNLKFDVEVLESREVKHEDNELEEQFRGAAALKTDLSFDDENIEMNDMDVSSHPLLKESHLYTSILLLILAILSISIYAILVVWRSRLEQRYGMRELLITDDFDEFYRQQQQQQHHQDDDSQQANNNSSNYNNNNNYNHDNANQQRGIVLENGQQPQYYLVHA